MTHPFLAALGSAILVSCVSLAGLATLPLGAERLHRITFVLISLATGALFGDAIIHLLPDIFHDPSNRFSGSFWILMGLLSSFVFEKFLRWKQEHGLDPVHESHLHQHPIKPVGKIILLSDGLHNFVDGLLIGASYLAGQSVGVATTLAVVLHELPHEIGDFGVLIHSGWSRGRALLFNFLSAGISVLGVFAAFGFHMGMNSFTRIALPITAGSFLYIAGSNLTPELQKENAPLKSLIQCLAIGVGVGLMALLLVLE